MPGEKSTCEGAGPKDRIPFSPESPWFDDGSSQSISEAGKVFAWSVFF
jgi:hypothetical protein